MAFSLKSNQTYGSRRLKNQCQYQTTANESGNQRYAFQSTLGGGRDMNHDAGQYSGSQALQIHDLNTNLVSQNQLPGHIYAQTAQFRHDVGDALANQLRGQAANAGYRYANRGTASGGLTRSKSNNLQVSKNGNAFKDFDDLERENFMLPGYNHIS